MPGGCAAIQASRSCFAYAGGTGSDGLAFSSTARRLSARAACAVKAWVRRDSDSPSAKPANTAGATSRTRPSAFIASWLPMSAMTWPPAVFACGSSAMSRSSTSRTCTPRSRQSPVCTRVARPPLHWRAAFTSPVRVRSATNASASPCTSPMAMTVAGAAAGASSPARRTLAQAMDTATQAATRASRRARRLRRQVDEFLV